jgi:hypothetical protein
MSTYRVNVPKTTFLLLILILLTACSTAPQSHMSETEGGVAEGGGGIDQGTGSEGEGSDTGVESGEPGTIAINCPQETTYFKLELGHSFSFSPGGNKELMQVTGSTTGDAWCLVSVEGNRVNAEPCIVGYEYSGFLQTDAGQCDITGTSTALVEIEGECALVDPDATGDKGVAEITLAITETQDPDAGLGGAMNCPEASQPYMGFYPPTFSVMTFLIDDNGSTDTDADDSDISGQFSYQKSWTLTPSR